MRYFAVKGIHSRYLVLFLGFSSWGYCGFRGNEAPSFSLTETGGTFKLPLSPGPVDHRHAGILSSTSCSIELEVFFSSLSVIRRGREHKADESSKDRGVCNFIPPSGVS